MVAIPFVMELPSRVQACRKGWHNDQYLHLASDFYLVEFVKQMSAMTTKGYFANPLTSHSFVLIDFLRRRTSRSVNELDARPP